MRQYKACVSCKNKYDVDGYDTPTSVLCKSCTLIGRRLAEKFNEMLNDPRTGLAELESYINEWYVIA